MSFGPGDKKVEAVLHAGQIVFEIAGLFFPPIAVAANDVKAIADLYQFLSDHVASTPVISTLPGPPLIVKNPAEW
jgi:hypothetical protein